MFRCSVRSGVQQWVWEGIGPKTQEEPATLARFGLDTSAQPARSARPALFQSRLPGVCGRWSEYLFTLLPKAASATR